MQSKNLHGVLQGFVFYSLGSGNAVEVGSGIYDMPINTQNVFSHRSDLPVQSHGGLLRVE